jgi:alkylation response protein AidB-like acyl-CoA dehydrogenase
VRFAFSDEQQEIRRTVRELLAHACPPAAVRASWSDATGRSRKRWTKLAELGLVGITVPEAYGGLGQNELDWVLLFEEAGAAALPEPLCETTAVGAPLLAALASETQRARWLPEVAAGRAILTAAIGGALHLPDAHVADLALIERAGELHAVERAALNARPLPSVDGARRLYRIEPALGVATLIARGAEARPALDAAFDRGALATAAQLCGLGRRMLDMTVEYVKVRQQFGQAVGAFQAVKHHLADALLALELARPVVYRAAYSAAHASPDRATHVSMAKAYASNAAHVAARAALQCHGAIGYSYEHDLHLWMKRAWALEAAWGDAAWHRARVACAVLETT